MRPAQNLLGLVSRPKRRVVIAPITFNLCIGKVLLGQLLAGRVLGGEWRDDIEHFTTLQLVTLDPLETCTCRGDRIDPTPQLVDGSLVPILLVLFLDILERCHFVNSQDGDIHTGKPAGESAGLDFGLLFGQRICISGLLRIIFVDGKIIEFQWLIGISKPNGIDRAGVADFLDSVLGRRSEPVESRLSDVRFRG